MPDIFVAEDNSPEGIPFVETKKEKEKEKEQHKTKQDAGHLVGVFHAFCEDPAGITLQSQDASDPILLFLRKHFVTNVPWILQVVLLLVLPIVLISVFGILNLEIEFLPPVYSAYVLILYYFVVVMFGFISFITWFYNISLVTRYRIVDIDFKSLVYKNVAATKIGQVEDVSYTQVGVVRSIFNYGDVLVQTAGEAENFDFLAVPHPEKVVGVIESLMRGGKH